MDPFATLGLPPSFDLDARMIAERKLALSRALHPDRYVGRPAGERRAALSKALEVNEAARRLANPLTRAQDLLVKWGDETPETTPAPSQAFLMNILELREELRAAGRAHERVKLDALMSDVEMRKTEILKRLSVAFAEVERGVSTTRTVLHQLLSELRYLQRFSDEAEAFLDEMPVAL
jgi:molecular chaperone HscB